MKPGTDGTETMLRGKLAPLDEGVWIETAYCRCRVRGADVDRHLGAVVEIGGRLSGGPDRRMVIQVDWCRPVEPAAA